MHETGFVAIFKESFTLWILTGCSVLSITFGIERWLYFRKAFIDVDGFLAAVHKLVAGGDDKKALALCDKNVKAPVANVVRVAIANRAAARHQVEELMTATRMEQKVEMTKFLGILGTLGNATPFIGLFGTVVGIIKAFKDLALAGQGGPAVVAAGIAEALVATAAGLAVAIPAVVLFNYYMRKVTVLSSAMESAALKISAYLGLK